MSVQVDITKRVVLIPMTMVSATLMSMIREASIPHILMLTAVSTMFSRRKVKSIVEIVIFEAMLIMNAGERLGKRR